MTFSSDPYPVAPEPAPITRPQSIVNAVRLMWVGAAYTLVGAVLTVFSAGRLQDNDEIRDRLRDSDKSLSESEISDMIDAFTTGFRVIVVVVGLIAVALWLWLAAKNGQGRRWARTTSTVLGALGIILGILTMTGGGAQILTGAIFVVLAGAVLFLLYRPDASRYFDLVSP